ncbi:MAG: START-like domain-containing protein [Bacteroidota bacterium]|nr:START-like domain-containing protein [Bacteroidota bacterium]
MSKKKAKSSQKKGNDKKTQTKKKVISKTSQPKKGKAVVKAKKVVAKSKSSPVKKSKVIAKPVRKAVTKKSVKKPAPKKNVRVVIKSKPAKKTLVKKAPVRKTAAKKSVPVKKTSSRHSIKKPLSKKVVSVKSKASSTRLPAGKGGQSVVKPVSKVNAVKQIAKAPVKLKTVVVKPSKVAVVKPAKKIAEKVSKPVVTKTPVEVKAIASKPISTNHTPKLVVLAPEKNAPEPKGKYELEYVIHTSTSILFEFLTSPSGLSEWFCDDVNIRDGIYTFFWDGSQQQAKLIRMVEEKLIRYQWLDKPDGSYFEFRIEKDDLTNDISLIVTDFSDNDDEKASSKLLWDSQIDKLLHVLGSYF